MKNLYIFNDHNNYFSKVNYQFGIVNGNTAIWEKNSASKNEKIIFQAKDTVNCTITKISIINEAGEKHTYTPNPSQPHAEPLQQRLSSNRNSCSLPPTKPLAFRHRLSKTPLMQAKFPIATGQAVCCSKSTRPWQGSVTNLSVTDSNGNTYYYWAVKCHGLYAKLSVPGC